MLEAAFEMPHIIGIEITEETTTPRGPSYKKDKRRFNEQIGPSYLL